MNLSTVLCCATFVASITPLPALTLVHTQTVEADEVAVAWGPARAGGNWEHPIFDTSLGNLTGVSLEMVFTTSVSVFMINHYTYGPLMPGGPAIEYAPTATLTQRFASSDAFAGNTGELKSIGAPVHLEYDETSLFTTAFSQSLILHVNDAPSLARFSGAGAYPFNDRPHWINFQSDVQGSNGYGFVRSTGTTSLTLTYTYAVTDTDSGCVTLIILMVFACSLHRLRPKNLPSA